jgi:uncharacterized membrane protein YccC
VVTGGRAVDALRLTTLHPGAVARSQLGVLAMAAVALYWGSPAAAMWAAGAAAIAGAIALQDSPGGRVPLVIVVSLQMGAAVLLGALTAFHDVVFVGVVAVWCFAAGMQWALGGNAGLVAAAASALLVIAPAEEPSLWGVVVPTVLTIAAGCVQAALVAVWPPQRWRLQRDALTEAYRTLAADARSVAADRDAPVDVGPLTSLREAFVDSQATRRPKAYHGGFRLPERITASLSALRGSQGGDGVSQMLSAAAVFLDAVADHSHNARRDAEQALERVDAAVAAIPEPEAAILQRFSQQLHEAATVRFGELRWPDLIGSLGAAATVVGGHLTWKSPVLRHAIRLSSAAALGMAAARFGDVAHGHWIALTVLIVLRPETAHTYTRCVGRIAGIAAGISVASVLTLMWQPTSASAAVVAVVFVAVTYAVTRFGYLAVSAALAASIVFLLDINAEAATIEDRLFAVVVGGGLALVAHVLMPDHSLIRLRQRAGELLKTEIDYAATVVKAFVHALDHPADALSAAWQRAYRARAAFEAASGATRLESRELRRWLRSYRAALNVVTSACTSLEGSLPTQPTTALPREFVAAVDDYVDALRGGPPSPATPWTVDIVELTAANQTVQKQGALLPADKGAARVLVAELATITRSLSDIAASLEPTSAG